MTCHADPAGVRGQKGPPHLSSQAEYSKGRNEIYCDASFYRRPRDFPKKKKGHYGLKVDISRSQMVVLNHQRPQSTRTPRPSDVLVFPDQGEGGEPYTPGGGAPLTRVV